MFRGSLTELLFRRHLQFVFYVILSIAANLHKELQTFNFKQKCHIIQ